MCVSPPSFLNGMLTNRCILGPRAASPQKIAIAISAAAKKILRHPKQTDQQPKGFYNNGRQVRLEPKRNEYHRRPRTVQNRIGKLLTPQLPGLQQHVSDYDDRYADRADNVEPDVHHG